MWTFQGAPGDGARRRTLQRRGGAAAAGAKALRVPHRMMRMWPRRISASLRGGGTVDHRGRRWPPHSRIRCPLPAPSAPTVPLPPAACPQHRARAPARIGIGDTRGAGPRWEPPKPSLRRLRKGDQGTRHIHQLAAAILQRSPGDPALPADQLIRQHGPGQHGRHEPEEMGRRPDRLVPAGCIQHLQGRQAGCEDGRDDHAAGDGSPAGVPHMRPVADGMRAGASPQPAPIRRRGPVSA